MSRVPWAANLQQRRFLSPLGRFFAIPHFPLVLGRVTLRGPAETSLGSQADPKKQMFICAVHCPLGIPVVYGCGSSGTLRASGVRGESAAAMPPPTSGGGTDTAPEARRPREER